MRLWQTKGMVRSMTRSRVWDFLLGASFVVAVASGVVYTAQRTDAATASVTYTFSSGQKIVASQINTNFNDILGALNGNLNTDNFLDGGIATADLGTAVVTTAKINNQAVTTAKLASANVVESNFSPYGTGQDQNCVVASATITVAADRPVLIMVTDRTGTGNVSDYGESSGAWEVQASFRRNAATQSTVATAGTSSLRSCSSFFQYVDRPGAGTHSYTFLNTLCPTTQSVSKFRNCKLQLQEL